MSLYVVGGQLGEQIDRARSEVTGRDSGYGYGLCVGFYQHNGEQYGINR